MVVIEPLVKTDFIGTGSSCHWISHFRPGLENRSELWEKETKHTQRIMFKNVNKRKRPNQYLILESQLIKILY